jgi:hypothetical protein
MTEAPSKCRSPRARRRRARDRWRRRVRRLDRGPFSCLAKHRRPAGRPDDFPLHTSADDGAIAALRAASPTRGSGGRPISRRSYSTRSAAAAAVGKISCRRRRSSSSASSWTSSISAPFSASSIRPRWRSSRSCSPSYPTPCCAARSVASRATGSPGRLPGRVRDAWGRAHA